jgi:two-component system, LytTR family, sensor kinase
MPAPLTTLKLPLLSRLSFFWQLQILGWGALSILSFPLKQVAFGSTFDAFAFTAYQLPLGIAVSTLLHWFYRKTWAREDHETAPPLLVLAGATGAALLDCLVSLPVNHLLGINAQSEVVEPALFCVRAAIYLIWSLAFFLIKTSLAAQAQAFEVAVTDERHRFELLRYQLNPNFLAKSLANISREIAERPETAHAMTLRLAAFYQNALRRTDRDQVTTIGDEIALVRTYLEIESLRQRDALKVNFAIDESLLSLPLPPIMLLPLAEQAVKIGRGLPGAPLMLTVTAERSRDGMVLLEVANSGALAGVESDDVRDVRASLERHYPGVHRFSLRQDSFTTRATIFVPLPA